MLEDSLNQKATVWTRLPPDEFGPGGWGPPVVIDVRWQDKQQLIRTASGDESMSAAVVYTMAKITPGSRIYRGETNKADPTEMHSHEFMAAEEMTDLDGETVGWKVYV